MRTKQYYNMIEVISISHRYFSFISFTCMLQTLLCVGCLFFTIIWLNYLDSLSFICFQITSNWFFFQAEEGWLVKYKPIAAFFYWLTFISFETFYKSTVYVVTWYNQSDNHWVDNIHCTCLLFASFLVGIVLVEGLLFMHFYGVCTQIFISFIFKLFAEYVLTFLL